MEYFPYSLHLRASSGNAVSARRVLSGFLLRTGAGGHGCVHPWPELGDAPVETQLALWKAGLSTPLLENALKCAELDAAAREEGCSLFAGLAIPRSHHSVSGDALDALDVEAVRAEGFTHVKVKVSGDVGRVLPLLRQARDAGLLVRLDFNGTGTEAAWQALAPWREVIDFIEDPVPYEGSAWAELTARYGFRLALDRGKGADAGGYAVRVLKPAVDGADEPWERAVITSYMDHPVGQLYAAYVAAEMRTGEVCGLLTQDLFLPDGFLERMESRDAVLVPPEGTGLGFDELLGSLPWQPLVRSSAGKKVRTVPVGLPREAVPAGTVSFATSGSTGAPRHVCIRHEALEASARAVNAWLRAEASDVWLRVLPEIHVGGYSIGVRARLSGARLVEATGRWDAAECMRLLEAERVTLTSLVPTQVHDLVAGGWRAPGTLRAVLVGGGALQEELWREAAALGWPLLPSYGMTEAGSTIAAAVYPAVAGGSMPVMELLDGWEARREETTGCLELRGPSLCEGYVQADGGDWTFMPALDADGWFSTQDRGEVQGRVIHLQGRADRMVKILGEQVNLDAVERALEAMGMKPGVGVVLARPHVRNGHELVFVTELPKAEAAALAHRWALEGPAFARLAACLSGRVLPRSALGKIRRGELAEWLARMA